MEYINSLAEKITLPHAAYLWCDENPPSRIWEHGDGFRTLPLRLEKLKWDDSLDAMAHIFLWFPTLDGKITKKEFYDELHKGDLPSTTEDKIWKRIPDEAGSPYKTVQVNNFNQLHIMASGSTW